MCIELLDAARGGELLCRRDAFSRALSQWDRSARMQTAGKVSEDDLLVFAGRQVVDWTPEEQAALLDASTALSRALGSLDVRLPLPTAVEIVKTTGAEEGTAVYTRGGLIVFPAQRLKQPGRELTALLAHEVFHLAVRRMSEARKDALYGIAGFRRVRGLGYPRELEKVRVTHPDLLGGLTHAVRLAGAPETWVVPMLLAHGPWKEGTQGPLFRHVALQLLEIRREEGRWSLARSPTNQLVLRTPDERYTRAVGVDAYNFHPEEILATIFAELVTSSVIAKSSPLHVKLLRELRRQ